MIESLKFSSSQNQTGAVVMGFVCLIVLCGVIIVVQTRRNDVCFLLLLLLSRFSRVQLCVTPFLEVYNSN